jgi:hypothetical protein
LACRSLTCLGDEVNHPVLTFVGLFNADSERAFGSFETHNS